MKAKSMSIRSIGFSVIFLLLFSFSMLFLTGCGNSQQTAGQDSSKVNLGQEKAKSDSNNAVEVPSTAKVTPDQLEAAINTNKGWQLVDIREPREFASGHIKMALNRPLGNLENNLGQISKEKEIVLIDLNGSRSESAYQLLLKNGYDQNKVKILTGGMLQWSGIVSAAGTSSDGKSESGNNNTGSNSGNSAGSSAPESKPVVQGVVGGC